MIKPEGQPSGLRFADERPADRGVAAWTILVADDEPDVHAVTELALRNVVVHGRPLKFLHAYSGRETVEVLRREADVALLLLDVVMETEHAGLDAARDIRDVLGNHRTRIVLRTGHPGQAPEEEVVRNYDINDYKEKTELTSRKLFTLVHTSLSHYRELSALEAAKAGLETVIAASASLLEIQSLHQFARGLLQQLSALLYASPHCLMVQTEGLAASRADQLVPKVVAATGRFTALEGRELDVVPDESLRKLLLEALRTRKSTMDARAFVGYFHGNGDECIVYLTSDTPINVFDRKLIDLFSRNVSIAFRNLTRQ